MPRSAPTHRPPQADAPTHAGPALRARLAAEQARGTASSRGYGATWRRLRAMVLAMEPTCRACRERGAVVAATDVDHVVARRHGGQDRLDNLQPLCGACHRAKTVAETLKGRPRA